MTESLSIQEARKLVLLSQRLPATKQTGSAIAATLSAIEHLGYIQIDTISADPVRKYGVPLFYNLLLDPKETQPVLYAPPNFWIRYGKQSDWNVFARKDRSV